MNVETGENQEFSEPGAFRVKLMVGAAADKAQAFGSFLGFNCFTG